MTISRHCSALMLALGSLVAISAPAQTVYRIVGPDGKVTFSDRPPVTAKETAATVRTGTAGAPSGADLPAELRDAVQRYPVTLYTTNACAPCASARSLLTGRGIPFAEKTVTTATDSEAFRKLFNDTALPALTVGAQQLKGFTEVDWHSYLDAAGYPKDSLLPAGYKSPAPSPLTSAPASATTEPAKPQTLPKPPPQPAVAPVRTSPANPAGIQF